MNIKQNGFAHIMILLVVIVLAGVGFGGWWVWHNDQTQPSFPGCTQIGAPSSDQTPDVSCKKSTPNNYEL